MPLGALSRRLHPGRDRSHVDEPGVFDIEYLRSTGQRPGHLVVPLPGRLSIMITVA
jgi:hypothetical protein